MMDMHDESRTIFTVEDEGKPIFTVESDPSLSSSSLQNNSEPVDKSKRDRQRENQIRRQRLERFSAPGLGPYQDPEKDSRVEDESSVFWDEDDEEYFENLQNRYYEDLDEIDSYYEEELERIEREHQEYLEELERRQREWEEEQDYLFWHGY